jgi:hypothetical protein
MDMDELSPEARAFLKLARGEHEPPSEQVLGRVRHKVAAAVLLPDPSLLSTAKLKLGGTFAHGALAKVGAGVLAVSMAGGAALLLRVEPASRAPQAGAVALAPAPVQLDSPVPSAPLAEASDGALRAELTLLERASERLARADLDGCLATLAEHRRQFPRALLVEERDGLEQLAKCTKAPRLARADAQQFVHSHPGAMLNVRIRNACKLESP